MCVPRLVCFVLKVVISYHRPPDRGRSHETHANGEDAAPEGSASSTEPPGASGDTARPNYMGPSGNGLVGADERGGKPAESRAFRLSAAPVCFQKAVSRSKENAALEGQAQPQGGHGAAIRTAPVGALPPRTGGHFPKAAGRLLPGTMEFGFMNGLRK